MDELNGEHDLLGEAAAQATALVGDGCVAVVARDDQYEAVAVAHQRRQGRELLNRLLDVLPEDSGRNWVGQALERRQTLRLPVGDKNRRRLNLPDDIRFGDVVLVPLPKSDIVLVGVRDRWSEDYSGSQRRQLERIAASTEKALCGADYDAGAGAGEFDPASLKLVDVTAAALWVTDAAGTTVYINEAASELIGMPACDVVGQPFSEYVGRVSQRRPEGFHGGEIVKRPVIRAGGDVGWLLGDSRPLPAAGGRVFTLHTLLPCDEQHRREVEVRLRLARTEALLELAEAAATGMPLRDVMVQAVSLVAEQLDVELAGIGSFDPDRLRGRALAYFGWPDPEQDSHGIVEPVPILPDSAGAAALHSGEPVLVDDYEAQDVYGREPLLERLGVRSAAIVPFASGTAAVAAHSTRPNAIPHDGIEVLESVARLLSPRWERAVELTADGSEPVFVSA